MSTTIKYLKRHKWLDHNSWTLVMYQQTHEESSCGTADPLGLSILKDSTVAQKTDSPTKASWWSTVGTIWRNIFQCPNPSSLKKKELSIRYSLYYNYFIQKWKILIFNLLQFIIVMKQKTQLWKIRFLNKRGIRTLHVLVWNSTCFFK